MIVWHNSKLATVNFTCGSLYDIHRILTVPGTGSPSVETQISYSSAKGGSLIPKLFVRGRGLGTKLQKEVAPAPNVICQSWSSAASLNSLVSLLNSGRNDFGNKLYVGGTVVLRCLPLTSSAGHRLHHGNGVAQWLSSARKGTAVLFDSLLMVCIILSACPSLWG